MGIASLNEIKKNSLRGVRQHPCTLLGCVWLWDSWGQAGQGRLLLSSLVPPILRDNIRIVLSLTLNQTVIFKGSSYSIPFYHYNQTHPKRKPSHIGRAHVRTTGTIGPRLRP